MGTAATKGPGADPERSLSSLIYAGVRERIINGDLPLGSRLRERELAETLGVSRVPLREALPQLETDGFITTGLRRGASVTQLTLRDVEELFEVRLGVEVYATRLAAQRIAAGADPAPLWKALRRATDATDVSAPDVTDFNAELHEAIVTLADNSLLTSMMRPVSGRDRWIFKMTADRDLGVACREHQALCEAIFAGNAEHAAALAFNHIEGGRRSTLDTLSGVLPDGGSRTAARLM